MTRVGAMIGSAAGAVLLGLPYIVHAFGPTEAEVVTWGQVSVLAGAVMLLLSAAAGRSRAAAARGALALGFGLLALLQVPPAILWFAFHGTGISDGSPPSAFVAHWGFALPHLALLAVCLAVVYGRLRAHPAA